MGERADIVVIGAGPAGMAAAIQAAAAGLAVAVLDDQPTPGGQIWRNVEGAAERGDLKLFGKDYRRGLASVKRFRLARVDYQPGARVVGVEPDADARDTGGDVLFVRKGLPARLSCKRLIVATGAYERPTPFPGWTLPGVMTLGAAQIALKTSDLVPERPFVIAGQGPLLLLLAAQLEAAGAPPDAVLDLSDPGLALTAGKSAAMAALLAPDYLAKGAYWLGRLRATARNVVQIRALGAERLRQVEWRTAAGAVGRIDVRTLLVHDGVIPNAQLTRAMRAPHLYDMAADAWRPAADRLTGQLDDMPWVHVAGDCAGVAGWAAAEALGESAGAAAATALGRTATPGRWSRTRASRARALRPFLDRIYRPARAFQRPDDATLVCRCEEVTAGAVRAAAALGAQGPNQLKAFTRAGMGPCQGRMCSQTVAAILADAQGRGPGDVGLMRVRLPISPLTVGELAGLNETEIKLPLS